MTALEQAKELVTDKVKAMIDIAGKTMKYHSAWGLFTIPPDIYRRSLKSQYGVDYLNRWCKFQHEKNIAKSK